MAFWEVVKNYQVLISSAAAIGSTFFIVYSSRKISSQKSAVDIVRSINQDDLMQEGLKTIRKHHIDPDNDIAKLAEKATDDETREDKKKVFYVLLINTSI